MCFVFIDSYGRGGGIGRGLGVGISGPADQPGQDCARACRGLKATGITDAPVMSSRETAPRIRCSFRIGPTLFTESSRGRAFYVSPLPNVTIIFVVAGRQLHSQWEKSGVTFACGRIRPVCGPAPDRRPPLSSSGAAGTPNLARVDRKHSCKLVSIRGYIGSR